MSMDVFEAAGIAPPAQNQAVSAQPNQDVDIFQAAGIPAPQGFSAPPPGIFNATSMAAKLPLDALAGVASYGHDLLNTPHAIANSPAFAPAAKLMGAINPAFNVFNNLSDPAKQRLVNAIPTQPDYNIPQMLGIQNPNLADNTVQGLFHYAPYVASALDSAASLAKPAMSTALSFVRPQAGMNDILQNLGGGQSLEENAQSLAQALKAGYGKNVDVGKSLYKPVVDAAGNGSIYENAAPGSSAYQALDDDIFSSDTRIKKMNQEFSDNPNFQNAHNLQSQLGSAIRKLQGNDAKGTLSIADRNTLYGYQDAQDAVKGDIRSFLNSKDPNLANQYQAASTHWATNVAPYTETPKLAQIVKGDITNPTPAQIHSIFKSPEPEIQKVVSDMGTNANSKILYNQLGKSSYVQPEDLMKAYGRLNDQGLGSYVTPEIDQQFDSLGTKIRNRNYAVKGTGVAAVSTGIPSLYHWVKHALTGGQ